ncbi:MAG TPA: arginine--tRNA ligase [Vicinamibacteria bacterium]|nr:arginine--tRNA ligase [Vicinamibacteria bacterium]
MILDWQRRLGTGTQAAVKAAFGAELPGVAFQYPPKIELGDLALTAPFDLARSLKRKPREIAEELARALDGLPGVSRAEVAGGGYVNLFLDRGAFARELRQTLADGRLAPRQPGRVIVEHTSINPNKAAHIGHLRNATIGDTFVRLLKNRGHEVSVQNYIDDTGVQVADVVVGFQHLENKGLDEVAALDGRFDYHCWELYARVGDFYAADPKHKALQAETLHAIEEGGNPTARLAEHIASRIVDAHLATMGRLGIRYDLLARESDILRLHFWNRAFELLKESGTLRLETEGKNAGCWVLAMEGEAADEDKIIVRSNGTVTYTGKDIAYQLWKLGRLDRDFRYRRHGDGLWTTTSGEGETTAPPFGHASAVYNVIDVGQSYPQRVVKAGVAALGHGEGAAASHHLAYEKVVLSKATARALGYDVSEDATAVKVSGRKGLGVKADDLIDALIAKAEAEIQARDPERPVAARHRDATAVAVGALRYFLLKFSRTKIITFDMEEALAFTGETGPYLQNALVRARNIFAKLEASGHPVAALLERAAGLDLAARLTGEEGDEAWSLLLLIARTDDAVEQAVRGEEPAIVAKHAFAVAQAFHSYYQKPKYSVLYADDDDTRAFRTLVVSAFVRQMEELVGLLGIPIPDRM